MLPEVLDGLITARILMGNARELCFSGDRHRASAGLVSLQDAFEMIGYCCLVQLKVDELRSIDKLSFDDLLGELKLAGHAVAHSGKLKAMNKQRVVVKHHAQMAEPKAAESYWTVANRSADQLLSNVIGRTLEEIEFTLLLDEGEPRRHFEQASQDINDGRYLDGLIEIRRAIFVAIENDYNVSGWRDAPRDGDKNALLRWSRGGWRAPAYARGAEWIKRTPQDLFDCIVIDEDDLLLQLLEAGVDPVEFKLLQHQTPRVIRTRTREWRTRLEISGNAWLEEAGSRRLLSLAVEIVYRLQTARSKKHPSQSRSWKMEALFDSPVYGRASRAAEPGYGQLISGKRYECIAATWGIEDENEEWAQISNRDDQDLVFGFVPLSALKRIEQAESSADELQ